MLMRNEISCEITEKVAVLSQRGTWTLELNIVKWGDNEPKIDIRTWNEDHAKCGKGITLTKGEAKALVSALKEIQ